MSMVKLIHSSSWDPTVGVGAELIKRAGELSKQASTIFGKEYDELKPDDKSVGIHVVALGDAEHYGMNRNGDLFSKKACIDYHNTFMDGCVFRHHRNKDAETQGIGKVAAAAYNPDMGRVELFIHADKEKAAPELERLEKEGEIPFSMACLRAGTPVLTRFGVKPIEEICELDTVLTHRGNWKRVERTMRRTADSYCRVSFVSWGGRVLEITPNHPVYAVSFDDIPRGYRKDHAEHPDKGWRRRHREELHRYLKWIPAGELTGNHYMCVPAWNTGVSTVGVDRARLYGYYIAEGSLKQGCVTITCNTNDVFVDEIEKLAEWTSVSKKPHRLSEKCVVLNCFSTQIRNELESVCGRRCENKKIPESIRFGSLEEKFNFVAAWFNGDGWQDKNGMHWSVHPKNLALDLQILLSSMGVRSSCDMILHPEKRGRIESKDQAEYVVTVSNESSGLFSDISKAKDVFIKDASKTRPFFSGGYLMVPVKSVETVDEPTEVYNFSVEDDESYTVYGLAVHNCTVPNDRCSICGSLRKSAGDESECEHVRDHLGEQWDDGRKVGTFNDQPRFFDISFVGRPADRIAWNLKVASALDLDSVKYAEFEGVTAPDELAVESDSAIRKLGYARDIVSLQNEFRGWLTKSASVVTARDGFLYEFRKIAADTLPDETISRLREEPVRNAMSDLACAGVVMDVPTFFKYATGDDYEKVVKPYMGQVEKAVPVVLSSLVKSSSVSKLCNDTTYDAFPDLDRIYTMRKTAELISESARSIPERIIMATIDPKNVEYNLDNPTETRVNDGVVEKLAEAYISYELSAIDAVVNGRRGKKLELEALASVNNLQKK